MANITAPATQSNDSTFDQEFASRHLLSHGLPEIFIPMFGACIVGGLCRTLLKSLPLPYTVLLCITGILLGTLGFHVSQVTPYTSCISEIDPVLLNHIFMPVLIFNVAFEMDPHILWKIRAQVAVLALPGYLICSSLTGILAVKLFSYNWSWYMGMLFGAIVSSFDPVLSAAALKDTVTSKALIILIEGEALLCNSACGLLFELFEDLVSNTTSNLGAEMAVLFVLKFIGSPLLAFVVCKTLMFWLSRIFNDILTEVLISLAAVYMLFYFTEWFGMSGIIAVTCLGLLLDKSFYSPDSEVLLFRFWEILTFLANTFIFLFVGVVIATKTFEHTMATDIFYVGVLYIGLNFIRFVVVFALSPILSRMGYGFNWRWGTLLIWSGLRGTFTLKMALITFQTTQIGTEDDRSKILLQVSLITLLTLLINASFVQRIATMLGLHDISVPKRMAMYGAVRRIQENVDITLSMLKMDRFLADAKWNVVASATDIKDPYEKRSNSCLEDLLPHFTTATCPDCQKEIPSSPSQRELEEMLEEARLRILKAQMTSFFKQYNRGMLNREATKTLVSAAESLVDSTGKFMDIDEVKRFWEAKGFLVFLKKHIEQWVYDIQEERVKSPRSKYLKLCYRLVLNHLFDYVVYVTILVNIFPVVIDFIPHMSEMYAVELNILNVGFLLLYSCEAIMKVLALRRAYIHNYWNVFDCFLLIMGLVEMLVDNIISGERLKSLKTLRFLRLLRALRLIKIVMPSVLNILNRKLNKQLSFGYDIAMGLVASEEDVKNLTEQISDQEIITKKLHTILERNRQQSLKELGFLQKDHPDLVTAVKTKQAIRTILNSARETLSNLISGGIIDNLEGSKLEKRRAKIFFFDYLDVICKEGEMPGGLHLMVSGMVKLHGSSPNYGHSIETKDPGKDNAIPDGLYRDYRSSGAILGEVNCLTKQEMEYTVTCETAVQTCFILLNDLFEAFDCFLEDPSLEYKIWLSVAIQTAIRTLKENASYRSWTLKKMSYSPANSYVQDIELNSKFDIYDGTMDDAVLVYGYIEDCQQLVSYYAPCVIPKTCHQVQGLAKITKLLIIPSASALPTQPCANGKTKDVPSVPCLQHAAARRRASRGAARRISVAASESLIQLGAEESSTQKAIAWISAMFLLALIADCGGGTKVLTRNWGPQSTLYLKGKHGRRDVLEMEEGFPVLGPVSWMDDMQKGLLGSQGPRSSLEQIYKKLKLYKY
ncbi:sperm-specific sodium:proton exchanger-like isoform X2 [Dendropsophus ebraccatus]|uniref:sperm-specific sodium:proton exchanger-like isoform X2 n=1 Tax=Dendropsophus ebraccatus TaxID=150705 RepID=UPI003831BD76